MAKKLGLIVWESKDWQYRHISIEIRTVTVTDAARDVSQAAKRGYGLESARERLEQVLSVTGGRDTKYADAESVGRICLRWQADKDNGWDRFYAMSLQSCDLDTQTILMQKRVLGVIEKLGFDVSSVQPCQFVTALQSSGAVIMESINGVYSGYKIVEDTPDCLLPSEVEQEAAAVA